MTYAQGIAGWKYYALFGALFAILYVWLCIDNYRESKKEDVVIGYGENFLLSLFFVLIAMTAFDVWLQHHYYIVLWGTPILIPYLFFFIFLYLLFFYIFFIILWSLDRMFTKGQFTPLMYRLVKLADKIKKLTRT